MNRTSDRQHPPTGGTGRMSWIAVAALATLLPCAGLQAREKGNPLPPGTQWPWWHGPTSANAAIDSDKPLAQKPRLAWHSKEFTKRAMGSLGPYGELMGGCQSLAMHEDRIYASFFIGSDTKVLMPADYENEERRQRILDTHVDMLKDTPRRVPPLADYGYGKNDLEKLLRHSINIHADDVMVCLDAKTGKALWRTAVPGGYNIAKGTYGPHLTPGVDPTTARVYAVGSHNRVMGFDGKTGKLLWVSDELTRRTGKDRKFQEGIADRTFGRCIRSDYWHVVAVDGVVVCGGIGFDGQTGKVLWAPSKGRRGGWQWWPCQQEGKWYVISGPGGCFDIHTGEEVWQLSREERADRPNCGTRLAIAGDLMVAGNTCYRISPKKGGRERVWRNEKILDHMYCGAVINRGYYYVLSKDRNNLEDKGSCVLLKVDMKNGEIAREWKLPSNKYATNGNMLIAVNDHLFWFGKSTRGCWWLNLDSTPSGPLSDTNPAHAFSRKQSDYSGIDFSFRANIVHTPIAFDGRVYLRSEWSVACLDFNPVKKEALLHVGGQNRAGQAAAVRPSEDATRRPPGALSRQALVP